ncbi:MAG TPA: hypothetical protein VK961_11075 [Chthoniobacter sp.]|nr:hypothetical protein [Chthoniobacter sp.]
MEELTFTCPVCGADVPRRAKSCPDCGACDKSGWSRDHYQDGLSLPDDDFNYDEFAARELGGRRKQTRSQRFWMIVGIIVAIAMALLTLRGLW